MKKKRVAVLGSTGSIGQQALEVLQRWPDRFEVVALSAQQSVEAFAHQLETWQPPYAVAGSDEHRQGTESLMGHRPHWFQGSQGLQDLCRSDLIDLVLVGIVGFAGVAPTLAALESGKRVLTANKETFVTAGHLVQPYLNQIVPLDSEHSAIFQCLQSCWSITDEVLLLYLTASGGPFWNMPLEQFHTITPETALKHPTWQMGPRVTVDSATMMNKGLECIEAHHLFQLPLNQIQPVIHPQSIIHSAVAFKDGAMLAQLGQPDMRVPIQYGLSYPTRWPLEGLQTNDRADSVHLDLTRLDQLTFYPVDAARYPCLALAQWAGEVGGSLPTVLNAVDEMAVAQFLEGRIGFMEIPKVIEAAMQVHMAGDWEANPGLYSLLALDQALRSQPVKAFTAAV